jgi:hypothetical protein
LFLLLSYAVLVCLQILELFSCIRDATRDLHLASEAVSADKMGEGSEPDKGGVRATFEIKYLGRARVTCKKLSSDAMDTLAERLLMMGVDGKGRGDQDRDRRRHASGASIKVSLVDFSHIIRVEDFNLEKKNNLQNTFLLWKWKLHWC